MRKIIGFLAAFFALALPVFAQSTVTATVTDPDSTAWATLNGFNATYSLQLVNSAGALVPQGQAYRIDTGAVVTVTAQGLMDASGTFSVAIASSNNITPAGTKWKVQVCPAVTSAQCNTVTLPINASGTYSSQLSAGTIAPRIGGGIGNYAYNDAEVAAIPNNSYLNITGVAALRCYSTSWGGCGGSSSSGFPFPLGTSSISAAGPNLTLNGLTTLQSVIYLSAGSEIGAQCVSALTALGSAGGIIQLPNSASVTMTTTCGSIPQNVWVRGYGKVATKIACSVAAGDCFAVSQNPTTNGEIGGKFSDFEIDGAASANPTLIHLVGGSGWTFDNIQFQPYPGTSANAATCLEFESGATGIFTEGNTILPSVYFERQCTPSVYLHQAGGADTSFAYNHFDIHLVSQASYGVVVDGAARVYGGFMNIIGNHVGPNNGILTFNGTSGTGGPASVPSSAFITIQAEESGTGAGVVLNANTGGTINFEGAILNGPGGAFALATTIGGSGAAGVIINTPVQQDNLGNFTMPGGLTVKGATAAGAGTQVNVVAPSSFAYVGLQLDGTAIASTTKQQLDIVGHSFIQYDVTDATEPLIVTGVPGTFANKIETGSNSQFCWGAAAAFPTVGVCDTGLSRISANVIGLGNGTQGDRSAELRVGLINVATARKGTFTCTNAGTITITNSNETATSDVNISMNTAGGTITTPPAMKTVTAATGFTVLCGATDTSTYNYDILN